MAAVGVYCSSSNLIPNSYIRCAAELGSKLVKQGHTVIYGGASVGMMGALANSALDNGGIVHGIITQDLVEYEVAHDGLSSLKVVSTMHARKNALLNASDYIICLPGGTGTMEEFFEAISWKQMGIHEKPIYLLNKDKFYDHLLKFIENSKNEKFLPNTKKCFSVFKTIDKLLTAINSMH